MRLASCRKAIRPLELHGMSKINGGLVDVPSGVDHRYVAIDNDEYGFKWKLISELDVGDDIMDYGGCALLGSGQVVPIESLLFPGITPLVRIEA
jgi:hypothetical protein